MQVFICILAVAALAQAEINYDKYKPRDLVVPVKEIPAVSPENERIVGGDEATPHQFPWQVFLVINDYNVGIFYCGGSLISKNYVLTTASCVARGNKIEVILGAHSFRKSEPSQVNITTKIVYLHKNWNSQLLVNDIALVKFPKPVDLSSVIQPVNLPSRSDVGNTFVGYLGTVSGWGKFSDNSDVGSDTLRYVQSNIISNDECNNDYLGLVRPTNVCANGSGGKNFCDGDDGGPLTVDSNGSTIQIGIVAFGRNEGCEKGFAGVYTRVTSYLDWIADNTDVVIN